MSMKKWFKDEARVAKRMEVLSADVADLIDRVFDGELEDFEIGLASDTASWFDDKLMGLFIMRDFLKNAGYAVDSPGGRTTGYLVYQVLEQIYKDAKKGAYDPY